MAKVSEISPINQQRLRSLIKVQEIVEKLQAHILESEKMTTTQIRASEILLRKVSPDLQATQLTADAELALPVLKIVRNDSSAA